MNTSDLLKTLYITPLLMLLFSTTAQAVLVERNWQSTGDNALTLDTDTGLEWLDITSTSNMSYNEVFAELGTGGTYEGFSFASQEQILGLFSAVDLAEIPNVPEFLGGEEQIQSLLNVWGVTWNLGTGERTEFLTSNTDGLNANEHWAGRVFWLASGDTGSASMLYSRNDDYKSLTIGSALVRTASPVPLPAAFWLFSSGLIGLTGFIRRRNL